MTIVGEVDQYAQRDQAADDVGQRQAGEGAQVDQHRDRRAEHCDHCQADFDAGYEWDRQQQRIERGRQHDRLVNHVFVAGTNFEFERHDVVARNQIGRDQQRGD